MRLGPCKDPLYSKVGLAYEVMFSENRKLDVILAEPAETANEAADSELPR